ncbi:MAG: Smr/MutS family protein [Acidobacteria bacterium]|nr:Smr/MutS family protein [Acidobacteriota bacterium]
MSNDPVTIPIEGELDLHTFQPRDIPEVVAAFLAAAHERGLAEVRLVHGRGRGIQRAVVHRVAAAHPLVATFYDDTVSRLGATIAVLVAR